MRAVVRVKVADSGDPSFLPEKQTIGASGWDLRAAVAEDIPIKPLKRAVVPTGIFLSIPKGIEGQVRPRSGLAAKHGITLLNSPGTIDSDYRGEIRVIMINLGSAEFVVRRGDRIAQIIFARCEDVEVELVSELEGTERGAGGFGSTGT